MPPNFRPDSLWHSLCPSYSPPLRTSLRLRSHLRPPCPSSRAKLPTCLQRQTHTSPPTQTAEYTQLHSTEPQIVDYKPIVSFNAVGTSPGDLSASNAELEQALEPDVTYFSPDADYLVRTRTILRELVYQRNVRPEARHYKALVLANVSAENGSVMNVKNILEEMEREGVKKDSGLLHTVLRALATHPDYMLRNDILMSLKDHWFELRVSGCHDLIIGLLRERQIELAIDKVEQMRKQKMKVEGWLYNLLIYYLCNLKEFDEVIRFLRIMIDEGITIRPTLWYYVLDTAAQACHYAATSLAWLRRVEPGYINPPTGLCHQVLVTAARSSDPVLATSVIQHLSARRTKITPLDYEALIESYVLAGDTKTALEILCIMHTIDLEPTQASTRPIHESFHRYNPYLEKHIRVQTKVQDAYSAVQELHTQGRDIPIAAMNLILENSSSGSDALDIYKSIPSLCSANPNLQTFNFLFRALRFKKNNPPDRSALMFLVAEMKALAIEPDMITYDRILLVCAQHGFWIDATLFWREMRERGFMPRAASVMALLGLAREAAGSGNRNIERREFIEEVEKLRGEAAAADGECDTSVATDALHGRATSGGLTHNEAVESEARPSDNTAQHETLPPEWAKEIQWEAEGPGRHLQWSREVRDAMRKDIQEILQQELGASSADKALEKETH